MGEAGNPVLKSSIARLSALSRDRDIVPSTAAPLRFLLSIFLRRAESVHWASFRSNLQKTLAPNLPDRASTGQACRWAPVRGAQPMTKSQDDSTGDRMVWDPRGDQTWEV